MKRAGTEEAKGARDKQQKGKWHGRDKGQKGRPYLVCRDALHTTQPGAHLQLIACCWVTAGKVLEHCVYHSWSDFHSQYILDASPLYISQGCSSIDMHQHW